MQHISRTYRALMPVFERRMGMTRARWHMLKRLFVEGQLSQARLQERLQIDGAAITRQVKQLEEEGLVRRATDPRDNRFTLVALTEAGDRLVMSLLGERARLESEVTAGISPEEMEVVWRCLRRVRENLAALNEAEQARPGG